MTNYYHESYRSDEAVLAELGSRLSTVRLSRNMTQAELAHEAGISKRTLERIEAGQSAQITSLVRVLRALTMLDQFEQVLPPLVPGPIELLKHANKPPQRASGGKNVSERPWVWGEDQ